MKLEGFVNGGTTSSFMSAAPLKVKLTRTIILFTWTMVISVVGWCWVGLDLVE